MRQHTKVGLRVIKKGSTEECSRTISQNAAGLWFMLRAVGEASPSLSTFCGNAVAGNCFGGAKSAPPERIEANYFGIPLAHH